MNDEIKTCPFCGCDSAEIVEDGASSYVECLSCFARTGEFASSEHAAEAWNRRAKKSEQEQSLPITVRNSYMLGKIAELNEEIANLRTDVVRITSKNIEYEEREAIRKRRV